MCMWTCGYGYLWGFLLMDPGTDVVGHGYLYKYSLSLNLEWLLLILYSDLLWSCFKHPVRHQQHNYLFLHHNDSMLGEGVDRRDSRSLWFFTFCYNLCFILTLLWFLFEGSDQTTVLNPFDHLQCWHLCYEALAYLWALMSSHKYSQVSLNPWVLAILQVLDPQAWVLVGKNL